MAENIKISVVLAAYNGAEYIAQQLQSLLDQTLPPDEIIITDDSPDDMTLEAVKPFLSNNNITYYKNPQPLGVSRNFEKALSLARGEVILLCDQDDVWLPGKTAKLYNTLQHDPTVDAVFCNSTLVDENLTPLNNTLWTLRRFKLPMQNAVKNGQALKVFLKRVTCSSHNIAFKRRCLEYILPFPELAPFYPDTFIALSIAARGKWQIVPEELTLYRVHNSNESAPLRGNVSAAQRARSSHAALRNALIAREIIQRSNGTLSSAKQKSLQKFADFHQARDSYSSNIFWRTLQVLVQMCKLNYFCYANNLRTISADIFIK